MQLVSLRSHGTVRCCSARVSVGGAVGPVSAGSCERAARAAERLIAAVFSAVSDQIGALTEGLPHTTHT